MDGTSPMVKLFNERRGNAMAGRNPAVVTGVQKLTPSGVRKPSSRPGRRLYVVLETGNRISSNLCFYQRVKFY